MANAGEFFTTKRSFHREGILLPRRGTKEHEGIFYREEREGARRNSFYAPCAAARYGAGVTSKHNIWWLAPPPTGLPRSGVRKGRTARAGWLWGGGSRSFNRRLLRYHSQ